MKRKLVASLVKLLVDLLLGAFSLVFRLKDNSPGIPVTSFRELAEALARVGPIVTPAIRPADVPGTVHASSLTPKLFEGRSATPLVLPQV